MRNGRQVQGLNLRMKELCMIKGTQGITQKFLTLLLGISFLLIAYPANAKSYTVHDIYGNKIQFNIPSNKWIIINYWATWCSACVEEIPELNRLATVLKDKPAIFIAANFEALPPNVLRDFATHYNMHFPITSANPVQNLIDPDSFNSVPVTAVISPTGTVKLLEGEQSVDDILRAMA